MRFSPSSPQRARVFRSRPFSSLCLPRHMEVDNVLLASSCTLTTAPFFPLSGVAAAGAAEFFLFSFLEVVTFSFFLLRSRRNGPVSYGQHIVPMRRPFRSLCVVEISPSYGLLFSFFPQMSVPVFEEDKMGSGRGIPPPPLLLSSSYGMAALSRRHYGGQECPPFGSIHLLKPFFCFLFLVFIARKRGGRLLFHFLVIGVF